MNQIKYLALFFLGFCFFLNGCTPAAPQPYRIGVINFLPQMDALLDGFKEGMADAGYIEGEDIEFVYEGHAESLDHLGDIAIDLVENQNVDMLLSLSTASTKAAFTATRDNPVPVVFAPVTDPVGNGFVKSLSEPGGNLTGVTNGGSVAKRLDWLITLAPDLETLYIPYNSLDGSAVSAFAATQEAAAEFNITIIPYQIENDADVRASIRDMPTHVDGVMLMPDILAISRIEWYLEEVVARQIVFTGVSTSSAERGALMAFGLDFFDTGKQASRLADQIIQGTSPADLPVETAEFLLHINLKTANNIGLEISDEIIDQADEIIK